MGAVLTVGYWVAALFPMGAIVVLFGDCAGDRRANGSALCYAEQQALVRWEFAIAAIVYVVLAIILWRWTRTS